MSKLYKIILTIISLLVWYVLFGLLIVAYGSPRAGGTIPIFLLFFLLIFVLKLIWKNKQSTDNNDKEV
ncbi:hypothetical protein EDM00_00890 [Ornithobacterium rhinotracheale]|nr:hypothetical protein [Ornithobacterium rhinotracheale]